MASSIARCNSQWTFFFLIWGHVREHVYADPPKTVDSLAARLPAADTAVDTSILRRLEECHAAHCLLPCNRRTPLQTPAVITRHLASCDDNVCLENLTSPIRCINSATIFFTRNYTVQIFCAYYSSFCQHYFGLTSSCY
jgi:hypothetical protein